MRKGIYLKEEDLELLQEIKKEQGLSSDSATITYLIHQNWKGYCELAKAVREELNENYLPKERIRWGVLTAEQNSTVLLDAMNTLLTMLHAEVCIPVEKAPHPVIEQSQQQLKEKIAYFKQKSDERKSKGNV